VRVVGCILFAKTPNIYFTWLENKGASKVDVTRIADGFYSIILSDKWAERQRNSLANAIEAECLETKCDLYHPSNYCFGDRWMVEMGRVFFLANCWY
jgi:hypothetical protein